MEKSKLIKYLNNKMNGIVSEIKRANWLGEGDSKVLRLNVVYHTFQKDKAGGGYHTEDSFKIIDLPSKEIKEVQRNINIESLLKEDEFEVNLENERYSKDQLKKLQELRDERKIKIPGVITMHDYYASIKLGDKVWYKGEAGVVTFLHKPKEDGHLRFTVNVRGVETRYVNPFVGYYKKRGLKTLSKRKPTDYSNVEVSDEIKSQSTKKLLSRLKGFQEKGADDWKTEQQIRAELSTREHVPNKEEAKRNRAIAKKHGGSKSKDR